MRRILYLGLTLAMSAFLFTNCTFQDWEPQPSENTGAPGTSGQEEQKNVPFNVIASLAQTKTVTDGEDIVWTSGDALNVFHATASTTAILNDGKVELEDAGKGLFKGTLAKALKEGYSYDWYMFYPYTDNLELLDNAAPVTIGATASGVQVQNGNDSRAHLAGAAIPLYGTAMGVEHDKTPAAELHHLASIIEVNVYNGVSPILNVSEIKVTAAQAIAGSFTVDFVEGTITPAEGQTSNTAVLNVIGSTGLEKGQSAKFYLAVKPFTATPVDGLTISINGVEKALELTESLNFTAGQTTSIDVTYYTIDFQESLVGAYRINGLWVYGGTGPEYGGGGFVDMHNKTWLFDEEDGHGVTAEMDNYLEFTLTDLIDGGVKTTGKCINWAGEDGKNWSCWYKQSEVPWNKADITHFYRQIPVGESTWVRDYSVEPNTVTFTDSEGKETVLELLAPHTANGHEFTNETFHTMLNGTDNWNAIYNDIDKVYYKPRNYFIEVVKVEEVPAASKTSEPVFVPTLPPDPSVVPASIAGTYIHSYAYCNGGIDPAFVAFVDKPWAFNEYDAGNVYKMKDDIYVFTATGTDANGNETGEVDFQPGADGEYWDMIYPAAKHKKDGLGDLDLSPFYGKIPQGKSTYVYDKENLTITFTQGDKTTTANYLMPGEHTISGKAHTVIATFALDFDLNYTEPNVPGYAQDWSDFERFYVAPHNYVLHLQIIE